MAPALLGYWNIRGYAQPIRMLMEYVGMEWEEKYYVCGPGPDYDKSCWFNEKFNLGLDLPNLPYMFDGDNKISESGAIIRYIARKYDLAGKTEKEKYRVDMVEGALLDFRAGFIFLCYNPEFEKLKPGYLEGLPAKLEKFSKALGSQKYFVGDNITYVDFMVYEMLYQHEAFVPGCLDKFPNLKEFIKRIESLDKVAKYMKSPKYINYPFNNPMAKFGA